jgi:hypothetical protein
LDRLPYYSNCTATHQPEINMTTFLKIEQTVIDFAAAMAASTGKSWEVFRNAYGAVECGLAGTCAECPKFRLLTTVHP